MPSRKALTLVITFLGAGFGFMTATAPLSATSKEKVTPKLSA
jgi:hypothetical protein